MGRVLAPFVCDQCPKTFGRKGDLTRHKNLHLGIKPYECEYCDKSFSQYSGLKTHENVHNGNKPHICGYDGCTAVFGDPSSCARHRKETHRRVGAYCCPETYCNSRIKRRSAFAAHLKKHGINISNVDLESFAPPLLPSEPQASRTARQIIRSTRAPSPSPPPPQSITEEFQEQFCGFTDQLASEELVYRPPTSMSWSTCSDHSPHHVEAPLEPCVDFLGVSLSIADAVPSLIAEIDCSQYSTPSATASASTPHSSYFENGSRDASPSLGLYEDSGLFGISGQEFPSFQMSFLPFDTARINPLDGFLEFPPMAWTQTCN